MERHGRFQFGARNRRHSRVRHCLSLQHLPSGELPASRRCEPGVFPQIYRRFGPLRRCHLHPDVAGGRRQQAGLPSRDIQRRVQSHAPDEGSVARRLHPRRGSRVLRYSLRNVLLRRGPGQVWTFVSSILIFNFLLNVVKIDTGNVMCLISRVSNQWLMLFFFFWQEYWKKDQKRVALGGDNRHCVRSSTRNLIR